MIDSHCHLDVAEFDPDREAVLARARAAGVEGMVVPGIAAAGFPGLLDLCERHADLYPALGLHPVYLAEHGPDDLATLERRVAERPPVAVGEIGLDFFVEDADRDGQQRLLEAQLVIARDAGLPVLLHVLKAHDEVLSMLRRLRFPHGGTAHAFNGSRQQADQYRELGFKLGFGGVCTYERAKRIRRLAAELPLTDLILETDAPDLPPAAHQGGRNSPEYLPEVVAALAALRDEEPATITARTTATARELLGLERPA